MFRRLSNLGHVFLLSGFGLAFRFVLVLAADSAVLPLLGGRSSLCHTLWFFPALENQEGEDGRFACLPTLPTAASSQAAAMGWWPLTLRWKF